MSSPQAGIVPEGRTHFYYLEYQLHPDAAAQDVRQAIRSALAVKGEEASDTVVAFGKDAWERVNPAWHPEGFQAFSGLAGGDGGSVPSTQRDVPFWIQSGRRDVTMQVALAVHSFMQTVGALRLDWAGVQDLDSRDLIGFIDGTANPKGDKARRRVTRREPGSPRGGRGQGLREKRFPSLRMPAASSQAVPLSPCMSSPRTQKRGRSPSVPLHLPPMHPIPPSVMPGIANPLSVVPEVVNRESTAFPCKVTRMKGQKSKTLDARENRRE